MDTIQISREKLRQLAKTLEDIEKYVDWYGKKDLKNVIFTLRYIADKED